MLGFGLRPKKKTPAAMTTNLIELMSAEGAPIPDRTLCIAGAHVGQFATSNDTLLV